MITFTLAPAMLAVDDAARYCGIGRSLFLSLVDAGQAPEPVRLRKRALWRVADLDAWVAGGCVAPAAPIPAVRRVS